MRALLSVLLILPTALLAAAPAVAGPSCGTPDEHLNLVDTDVWYGGGGCYGADVRLTWACPMRPVGVDRPYAIAQTDLCSTVVLVQP